MSSLLLSFIPIVWLGQDVQNELLYDDGHFNYTRFWNPDIKVKMNGYHLWCWNGAGLKFTDQDIQDLFNGAAPTYTPLSEEDELTCGG